MKLKMMSKKRIIILKYYQEYERNTKTKSWEYGSDRLSIGISKDN